MTEADRQRRVRVGVGVAVVAVAGLTAWGLWYAQMGPVKSATCEAPVVATSPRPSAMGVSVTPLAPGDGARIAPRPGAVPAPAPVVESDPLVAGNVDLARQALELARLQATGANTVTVAGEYEQARRVQEARLIEAGVRGRDAVGDAGRAR